MESPNNPMPMKVVSQFKEQNKYMGTRLPPKPKEEDGFDIKEDDGSSMFSNSDDSVISVKPPKNDRK